MKKLYSLILTCCILTKSVATVLQVPLNYSTIVFALSAASNNDTILVAPGMYNENITWPAKSGIKLIGTGGSLVTTINGGGTGRVLNLTNSQIDTTTHIIGFTVSGGYIGTGSGYGAGIYISNASATLEDLVISSNRVFVPGGHGYGAGVHLSNSSSILKKCIIHSNTIDSATWCYGGGIYISGGSPEFTGVVIQNNAARAENWCYGVGLYARNGTVLKMTNSEVIQNISGNNAIWYYGNGVYLDDVTATLTNVLIADNQSGSGGSFNYGGGIYCDGTTQLLMMHVTIANNTKTGGASITGSGIYVRDATAEVMNSIVYNPNNGTEIAFGGTGNVTVSYSNIRNNFTGTGNINTLPGFAGPNDYHLSPASPCAGTGTLMGAPAFDRDMNVRPQPAWSNPDMGCYEVDQSVTGQNEGPLSEVNHLLVYPNPAGHFEKIMISYPGTGILRITDALGKVIYTGLINENGHELYPSDWSPGLYLASVNSQKPVRFIIR